jgi:hypothetical protein
MRALFVTLIALVVMLPAVAFANDAPGAGGTASPEPMAMLMLLAGAAPTYWLWRRQRNEASGQRSGQTKARQ